MQKFKKNYQRGVMKVFAKDLRNLTIDELNQKLKDAKLQMLHLRQKQQSQVLKPHELKEGRRNVAVIKTVMTEKKYEEDFKNNRYKPKLSKAKRQAMTKLQLRRMKNGKTRLFRKSNMVIYSLNE
ncbi:50S ribosomal protein L29 [Dictyocoela muelleri]|nr:50S ribosomal protein L29 [Dictyocoela muelleri]